MQTQDLRHITLGDMLEETACKFPTHQAVKYIEMEFDKTWYEFNNKVDRIAKGLMGMGFEKGVTSLSGRPTTHNGWF